MLTIAIYDGVYTVCPAGRLVLLEGIGTYLLVWDRTLPSRADFWWLLTYFGIREHVLERAHLVGHVGRTESRHWSVSTAVEGTSGGVGADVYVPTGTPDSAAGADVDVMSTLAEDQRLPPADPGPPGRPKLHQGSHFRHPHAAILLFRFGGTMTTSTLFWDQFHASLGSPPTPTPTYPPTHTHTHTHSHTA